MQATMIAVEGADRVGKATQTKMLEDTLRSDGHRVKRVEVPVKSPITYRLIYWMLRQGYAKTLPNLFQFVQFLNKFFFQVFHLVFMRWFCDYIVFDRWAASSIVYGNASGANPTFVEFLYNRLWRPDATIVMQGLARSDDQEDVYEKDNMLQAKVRSGYADFYLTNQLNVQLVDNVGTRDEVHRRIMRVLDTRFDLL